MDKKAVLDRIVATGVIPVIRAQSADEAASAIAAIQKGGVSVLEITMTVPGAIELIREVARRATDALVGAGTVLDPESALACIDAGARFVVSPALNLATIAACREAGVAVLPGALTPTEVLTAWNAGADFVKVFPANALGGPSYLKSLKAPLPQVEARADRRRQPADGQGLHQGRRVRARRRRRPRGPPGAAPRRRRARHRACPQVPEPRGGSAIDGGSRLTPGTLPRPSRLTLPVVGRHNQRSDRLQWTKRLS